MSIQLDQITKRLIKRGALCIILTLFALHLMIACDSDDSGDNPPPSGEGEVGAYQFPSRSGDGEMSVSYSGQIARHSLILQLKDAMMGLTDQVQTQGVYEEGEVVELFNLFFDCPEDICGGERIELDLGSLSAQQATLSDISTGKNLVAKLAGNDPVGQHREWSTELLGFGDEPVSPEALIRGWFLQVEEQAIALSNGEQILDPLGAPIILPYVSPEGIDYVQLTQKFLLGAIAYSQGADDYLDDTEDGKGLLSDHSELVEGKAYTALEHSWDEGFGYFGAVQVDLDLAGVSDYQGSYDLDGDGAIDLISERLWGHATNAVKRDLASDLTLYQEAFTAFYRGRAILANAQGALSDSEFTALKTQRDLALSAWERSIASTALHYINDVLADLGALESGEGSFIDLAKHWSELRGFALSLQFSPHSAMSRAQLTELYALIGDRPLFAEMEGAAMYPTQLIAARELITSVYRFPADQVETW